MWIQKILYFLSLVSIILFLSRITQNARCGLISHTRKPRPRWGAPASIHGDRPRNHWLGGSLLRTAVHSRSPFLAVNAQCAASVKVGKVGQKEKLELDICSALFFTVHGLRCRCRCNLWACSDSSLALRTKSSISPSNSVGISFSNKRISITNKKI